MSGKLADVFEDLKPFKDIFGVLDCTFLLQKSMGIAPYTRIKETKTGRYRYFEERGCKYQATFCIFWIMMIGIIMLDVQLFSQPITDMLVTIIYIYAYTQVFLVSVGTLTTFTRRIEPFLKTYDLMDDLDRQMMAMGMKISYFWTYLYTMGFLSLFPIFAVLSIGYSLLDPVKGMYRAVTEIICYGMPFIVCSLATLHFVVIITVSWNRFKIINAHLRALIGDCFRNKNSVASIVRTQDEDIQGRIIEIASLYRQLCVIVDKITYCVSVVLLGFYGVVFIQNAVFSLSFFGFTVAAVQVELYFWQSVSFSLVFMEVTWVEILKSESRKTPRLLCKLTLICQDKKITQKSNTALLQILQKQVDVKLCGFFPLSYTRMLENFGSITSLIMFILQFRTSP